jgi:hypothetical protein
MEASTTAPQGLAPPAGRARTWHDSGAGRSFGVHARVYVHARQRQIRAPMILPRTIEASDPFELEHRSGQPARGIADPVLVQPGRELLIGVEPIASRRSASSRSMDCCIRCT